MNRAKAIKPPPKMGVDQFAIFDHPADFPSHFVCRRFTIRSGQVFAFIEPEAVGTLDECRALVPAGWTRLERFKADDPVLLETWI